MTDTEAPFELSGRYLDLIGQLHRSLHPRNYLEIGVNTGRSLSLLAPNTRAVGVDPRPRVDRPISSGARVVRKTSDRYFAEHNPDGEFAGLPVDITFIDGMHLIEYALRDFRSAETWSAATSRLFLSTTVFHLAAQLHRARR